MPEEAAPYVATRMVNRVLGTSYTVEYVERKMRADPLFLTIVDAIGAAMGPELEHEVKHGHG